MIGDHDYTLHNYVTSVSHLVLVLFALVGVIFVLLIGILYSINKMRKDKRSNDQNIEMGNVRANPNEISFPPPLLDRRYSVPVMEHRVVNNSAPEKFKCEPEYGIP